MTTETKHNFTRTREELAQKHFQGFPEYANGNMGIVALLSDVQEAIGNTHGEQMWLINDIKAVLIEDHKKAVS